MGSKGIDVSTHNGNLNHQAIKDAGITFAMVRAGYGNGNVDKQFKNNMEGFFSVGVGVGAYWFLYSLNTSDAIKEADKFDAVLAPYKDRMQYPVACDFEYDSERYMLDNGVSPSKRLNTDIVNAFCNRMEQHGWYVMNYANIDFVNNHFYQNELERYDLWCAQWGPKECSLECGMWQYSSDGIVNGSSARTDVNVAYKDYPSIIAGSNVKPNKSSADIADEVLLGMWGNGEDRKQRISAAGHNYNEVQNIVNQLCGPSKADKEEVAQKVIRGDYGNGSIRRERIESEGYNYDEIQGIVNNLM